jgi:kynurenine 3-monooxygenase
MKEKITVLGAGLVGSLVSIFLLKRGFELQIFEKRADLRENVHEGGRSINLALSHRGLKALERVDLLDSVINICLPMKGRMMHDLNGALTFQPYGKESQFINSISRSALNVLLMNAAEDKGANIHFNQECLGANLESGITFLSGPQGNHQVSSDFIVGSDGAYSGLREEMRKTDRFNFSQFYLPYGYKELTIPPTSGGGFALEPEALHIWPREQFMLIALPNLDGSFTCTLFLPFEGAESFENLRQPEAVLDFFERWFGDAMLLMPDLVNDFSENPTSSLVTIKCNPWIKGKACLLGDASHAIVPFFGQGMNAGFEDCWLLDDFLDRYPGSFDKVFNKFQTERIPNTNAIAELAFQNFIEMRDLVADPDFLLRKKIEQKIHQLYPDQWIPLYSMVTFSDRPYSEAQQIGNVQRAIMDEVLKIPNIEATWESIDFYQMVKDLKARVDLT